MSGLEIAAGVIGIATAGMMIARDLYKIADTVGSAGEEVRICASDTDLFSQLLVNLHSALEAPTAASRATQKLAVDLVDLSERILEPFRCLIARLDPLLQKYRASERHLLQLGLRVQWYFRHRSKVTFYQQSLGQLKLTLSCLLGTMNLQESRASSPQTTR